MQDTHSQTHTHTGTRTSFQWGSIWSPTCLNLLVGKANKHWQGAYFPRLVNMYHCPISNVDTRRHPRKSTILLPSPGELALMLLSGVLCLPLRQRECYNETTSRFCFLQPTEFPPSNTPHFATPALPAALIIQNFRCDFGENDKVFFFRFV